MDHEQEIAQRDQRIKELEAQVVELTEQMGPDYHILEFGIDIGTWVLQHPLACRPNLLACPMSREDWTSYWWAKPGFKYKVSRESKVGAMCAVAIPEGHVLV